MIRFAERGFQQDGCWIDRCESESDSRSELTKSRTATGWVFLSCFAMTLAQPGRLVPALIVVDEACSLADAIVAANTDSAIGGCSAGSGPDELRLTRDVLLDTALPAIASDLTLTGSGYEISREPGAAAFRVLEIADFAVVTIAGTTVSNGDAGGGDGGGVLIDSGELVLINSTISENTAGRGGGLYLSWLSADVVLVGSAVTANSADFGGGIYNQGYLDITAGSLVSENVATHSGGGVHIEGYALADVSGSTISNNTAGGSGGGIFLSDSVGSLDYHSITVEGSTISGNTAGVDGGGLWLHGGAYDGGRMELINSTISDNTAVRGGGIYHADGDRLSLINSTMSGNSAGEGGAMYSVDVFSPAQPVFQGSVVAYSLSGGNCGGQGVVAGPDSFSDDLTCGDAQPITPGVDFDVDLSDNGGPTLTHAIRAGSPAVDAAGDCGLAADQRGFARDDGPCDSGSVEFGKDVLLLEGACPGPMTLHVQGLSPLASAEVFAGSRSGLTKIPSGPCAGTELLLADLESLGLVDTDETGSGTLDLDFGTSQCGGLVQAVDLSNCGPTNVESIDSCDRLALTHTGAGSSPLATPPSSVGCEHREFLPGEVVGLTAVPSASWKVGGWNGTDDDTSTDETNFVTMPIASHQASVEYVEACAELNVTRTGTGSGPVASPPNSPGCFEGEYLPGAIVELSGAQPGAGWDIGGWTGTIDDTSTESSNVVHMPSQDHTAGVNYVRRCFDLALEHLGLGEPLVVDPSGSEGCSEATYVEGELIEFTASPADGWRVSGWSNTDDDSSTQTTNTLTMPDNSVLVGVRYVASCFSVSLSHTGEGSDPIAVPIADGSAWFERSIASAFEDAFSVATADFDGDSDVDVVAASATSDSIRWFENLSGDGDSWSGVTIAVDFVTPTAVAAADIDADGDFDVIGAARNGDQIAWWRNDLGSGGSWTFFEIGNDFSDAFTIYPADIDGDLDLDVVVGGNFSGKLAWFENVAGDGSIWDPHAVRPSIDDPRTVAAADLDGDGDMDILHGGAVGSYVAWWENRDGDGSAWVGHRISTESNAIFSLRAADVDGDSDLDIVGSANGATTVRWWENLTGAATRWVEHPIAEGLSTTDQIAPWDIDGDGDLDVVGTGMSGDQVLWWENASGDGTGWVERVVASGLSDAVAVAVADLNADGSLDIVAAEASEPAQSVGWWESGFGGECPSGSYLAGDRLSLEATADPGWTVGGWSGTDDDASSEPANTATIPAADHSIGVNYVEEQPPVVVLTLGGSCPGELEVGIVTPEPRADVALFSGSGLGTSTVDAGPCSGTQLDLEDGRPWRRIRTDQHGEATLVGTFPAAWCGRSLQALDRLCRSSNVVEFD